MKGRKPKPTALKLLQGNPGHRAIDPLTEPQPVIGLGPCPPHLDLAAQALWHELGPQLVALRTLGETDAQLFALMCQAHSNNLWHSAKMAHLRGLKRLTPKQENALQIHESKQAKAAAQFQKISQEFGLGAASRTRIRLKPDDGQEEFPFDVVPVSPLERAMAAARSA